MTEQEKPLPCPFCGVVVVYEAEGISHPSVEDDSCCLADLWLDIRNWNSRSNFSWKMDFKVEEGQDKFHTERPITIEKLTMEEVLRVVRFLDREQIEIKSIKENWDMREMFDKAGIITAELRNNAKQNSKTD